MAGGLEIGVALRRFGLGGGVGDLARLGPDPLGALLTELQGVGSAPVLSAGDLLTTDRAFSLMADKRTDGLQRRADREARLKSQNQNPAAAGAMMRGTPADAPAAPSTVPSYGAMHEQELARLLALATVTPRPLEERLALFWTNHFTMSAQRAQVSYMVGVFEREAIRPNMAGRFEALLIATSLHPAMLRYLDNTASTDPNAPAGRGRNGAVNENLAREIMELHTLGVEGGYTQGDVTEFAKALSGWTAGGWRRNDGSSPVGTMFDPQRHDSRPRRIMGQAYAELGQDQAIAVLRGLAAHPATARHVVRRLVQHFIGDNAPPTLQARLVDVWTRSRGDLRQVTEALIRSPEAWSAPFVKLRSPVEFAMAACRVAQIGLLVQPLLRDLSAMGQLLFRATSPKGWPEEDDAWVTPDGIKTRLDWSMNIAAPAAGSGDPRALAERAFGPALSDETRTALRRAESAQQGFAIFLMSPEMQRR